MIGLKTLRRLVPKSVEGPVVGKAKSKKAAHAAGSGRALQAGARGGNTEGRTVERSAPRKTRQFRKEESDTEGAGITGTVEVECRSMDLARTPVCEDAETERQWQEGNRPW